MKTISPFLLSRATNDAIFFGRVQKFFEQEDAKKAGVKGIHTTHVMERGDGCTYDAPQFIIRDKDGHRLVPLDQLPQSVALPYEFVSDLNIYFSTDFLYISPQGINCLLFPNFCHFQAQNVSAEFRAVESLSRELDDSTWARAASSTFRFSAQSSSHRFLQLVNDIKLSQDLMAQFFPESAKEIALYNRKIESIQAQQLKNAIEP